MSRLHQMRKIPTMVNPVLSSENPDQSPPATPPASVGTATKTRPAPQRPPVDFLPLFRVLLHNDDKNEAGSVVSTIVELTPLNHDRAVQVMLEAHKTGVGLLLVTHKERAELYQEQFQSKFLSVTIEPIE
jgi:ATP-dependent Clp protease adaptor protein ClpS